MPAIRFPASAAPLLPLCKGHGENFIFRTYAGLIGLLAAYGYHLTSQEGVMLVSKVEFTATPNAIDIGVFENQGLLSNFLIVALSYNEGFKIAGDESSVAILVEKLAATGAERISRMLQDVSDPAKIIVGILQGATTTDSDPKI